MPDRDDTLDLRDLMLEAIADVREIFREVMIELTEPMINMQVKMMWAQMPPELKDKLAAERPAEYADLMNYLED